MFTGIIETTATVTALEGADTDLATLHLTGPEWLGTTAVGDSIAVDGVCLTVVGPGTFEVMSTTLALTTLGRLAPGGIVNLERAVRADGRLDGHLVTGHVDATTPVLHTTHEPGATVVRFELTEELEPLVARRGSIAVNGVSLTVSDVSEPGEATAWAEVSLIPETLRRTSLGGLGVGDPVNLEADVLARYAARRDDVLAARTQGGAA